MLNNLGLSSVKMCTVLPYFAGEQGCSQKQSRFRFDLQGRHRPGDTSGLNFVEDIRRLKCYGFTPVIIVTALQDEKLVTYEKLHCYSFVEKPFDEDGLKEVIEEALAFPGTGNGTKILKFRKESIILAVEKVI